MTNAPDDRSLLAAALADGRPLLFLLGTGLMVAGGFGLFLAVSGDMLPHDVRHLGMSAADLESRHEGRIAKFMVHDRASLGGALVSLGILYLWLAEFPLKRGEAWAWWTLLASGAVGFSSFFTWLAFGYLDVWHGVATLSLAPCFLVGMGRSWGRLQPQEGPRCLLKPGAPWPWRSVGGFGRLAMLLVALGVFGAGVVITLVGMTVVFVPQDLAYMGASAADIAGISPKLTPLIAHDRASFGGALASTGVAMFGVVWRARPSRGVWEALLLSGAFGFGAAIGVHPLIGYTDFIHLAPGVAGGVLFIVGMAGAARPGGLLQP